jgi:uncharacterized protein YuzE
MGKVLELENIVLPENKKVNSYFDKEADVLYISFGEPVFSEVLESGSDTLIRFDPETFEITGVTILNFSDKLKH